MAMLNKYQVLKEVYYKEWKQAEKEGFTSHAQECKEMYRAIVMEEINSRPNTEYFEELKQFPALRLN